MPTPAMTWGGMVQQDVRLGDRGEGADTAGDQEGAGCGSRRGRASDPGRGDRGDRQDGDRRGGRERGGGPAGHQQQHEQEQHSRERRGDQCERDRRSSVGRTPGIEGGRAGPVRGRGCRLIRAMRGKVDNSCGDARGQRDRDLREEDRPPVERLGQCAAERRPRREAEDRGGVPRAAARAATVESSKTATSTAAAPPACSARSTSRTSSEPARPQPNDVAAKNPPPAAPSTDAETRRRADERQRDREHQRVDAEHRRGALDRGVELVDDRRQRERDDRRVGERERGSEEEEGAADAHMLAISRAQPRTRRLKWRHATRARRGTAR